MKFTGLDEAHDIVLPYSLSAPSYAGDPILDSPAAKESEYCHALIHRKEGEHIGELKIRGWDNACFWFGKTSYHSLFPQVRLAAIDIAEKAGQVAEPMLSELRSQPDWHPDWFTNTCQKAVLDRSESAEKVCSEITNAEWKMLFENCNNIVNGAVN